jgi:hypothetical protein
MMDDSKQPQLKPFAVSVTEAARITASGESTIWEKLAKGELDAVKDGGRTKVTMASIERHVASWPKAKFQPLKPRRPCGEDDAFIEDRIRERDARRLKCGRPTTGGSRAFSCARVGAATCRPGKGSLRHERGNRERLRLYCARIPADHQCSGEGSNRES